MSIDGKYLYRFGFLKSDKWKTVRLEALVREKGLCQICGLESVFNDAHHIWYPENVFDTTADHLVILCRGCHQFVHTVIPECKTKDENKGMENWIKFRNAVVAWRIEHIKLFSNTQEYVGVNPQEFEKAYINLKIWISGLPYNGGKVTADKNKLYAALSTIRTLVKRR